MDTNMFLAYVAYTGEVVFIFLPCMIFTIFFTIVITYNGGKVAFLLFFFVWISVGFSLCNTCVAIMSVNKCFVNVPLPCTLGTRPQKRYGWAWIPSQRKCHNEFECYGVLESQLYLRHRLRYEITYSHIYSVKISIPYYGYWWCVLWC